MRAAIYARMSTDNQNETSPEDQATECRRYATEQGWQIPDGLVFMDHAISGATAARPGYQAMRSALCAGAFDVLLAFDGSRIARNERDFFELLDELENHNVRSVSVSTGQPLDELSERFLSVVSAHDRRRISAATRRGLKARAVAGKATGGAPYGYTTEPDPTGGKRLVVNVSEAVTVVQIYECFVGGLGLKALAHRLNAADIPAPRARATRGKGASWAPSAIHPMLRNEIYRGRLIYNRTRWVRQRDGKRKRIERPESEWIVTEDEDLRIVSEELWEATQESIAKRLDEGGQNVHRGRHPRRRFLFSGLLRCAECGYSFCSEKGGDVFSCSGRHARGACDVRLRVSHDDLEGRVLGALEREFLDDSRIARIVEKAEALVEAALASGQTELNQERLKTIERKIRRKAQLFEDEEDEFAATRLRRELKELRGERGKLRDSIAAAAAGPGLDRAAIRERLGELAGDLRTSLRRSADAGRDALFALLGEDEHGQRRLDVIEDDSAPGGYRLEGRWRVGLSVNSNADQEEPGRRMSGTVAGEGFEPPTSGL